MIIAADILPLIYATGTGDIDFTTEKGGGKPFVLSFLRCHFTGGTGTATFTISRDAWMGAAFDDTLKELTGAGTGVDVNFFPSEDEMLRRYLLDAKQVGNGYSEADKLKVAWTNPDSGNMRWALTIGLAHV